MLVKIYNTIFDSEKTPIALALTEGEKKGLKKMGKDATKFVSYPEDTDEKDVERFMNDERLKTNTAG